MGLRLNRRNACHAGDSAMTSMVAASLQGALLGRGGRRSGAHLLKEDAKPMGDGVG